MGLTGQRGRQGRDRANLLAPVNRYLPKIIFSNRYKAPPLGSQREFEDAVKGQKLKTQEAGGQEQELGAEVQGKSMAMRRELRGGGGGKCEEHKVRWPSIKR